MDPVQLGKLMAKLGITGVDPSKVSAAMELAQLLGANTRVDEEDVKAYYPGVEEESFYLPKAPKNFYYNSKTLRSLHSIDYNLMRELVTPNLRRLRR